MREVVEHVSKRQIARFDSNRVWRCDSDDHDKRADRDNSHNEKNQDRQEPVEEVYQGRTSEMVGSENEISSM